MYLQFFSTSTFSPITNLQNFLLKETLVSTVGSGKIQHISCFLPPTSILITKSRSQIKVRPLSPNCHWLVAFQQYLLKSFEDPPEIFKNKDNENKLEGTEYSDYVAEAHILALLFLGV